MFILTWLKEALDFRGTWVKYWKYETTGRFIAFFLRSLVIIGIIAIIVINTEWYLLGYITTKLTKNVEAPTATVIQVTKVPTVKVTTTTQLKRQPSPVPSNTFIFGSWDKNKWTTSFAETNTLALQSGVINLAACNSGECHFSKLYSIVGVSDKWMAANANSDVFNITHVNSPTGFSFQDSNLNSYVLNMYEPFIVSSQPKRVFMVDENGGLWYQQYSVTLLVPIQKAQAEKIPITIQANPELTGIKS